eukprot:COSAG06_NODE_39322_length_414_cov_0.577778_1_plen_65_part_00
MVTVGDCLHSPVAPAAERTLHRREVESCHPLRKLASLTVAELGSVPKEANSHIARLLQVAVLLA